MTSVWDIDFLSSDGWIQLENILSSGVDPDEEIEKTPGRAVDCKKTLIIPACMYGASKVVEVLLKFGANPNYISNFEGTPLSICAGLGNLDMCRLLVDNDVDVNLLWRVKTWPFGAIVVEGSPVYNAAERGRAEVISFLIDCDAKAEHITDRNKSPIGIAAENGHLEAVRALVKGGADINFKGFFTPSALYLATINNHFEIVRFLVENGADINSHNDLMGATPLFIAQRLQHQVDPEIRRYLIENGGVAKLYPLAVILMLLGIVGY